MDVYNNGIWRGAVFLVVGMIAGFFVGRAFSAPEAPGQSAELQKLHTQIAEAKKSFPVTPQDMRAFSGTVASVEGDAITINAHVANPFDDLPNPRIARIGANTRIDRLRQKDPAVYQKESAAYTVALEKAIRAGAPPPVVPDFFDKTPASREDILPGDEVTVTADENIRDKQSFDAASVGISFSSAAVPAP